MSDVPETIISKIIKLFELAKSSNENEASVALSKAHDLLKNYNLEMSDITSSIANKEKDSSVKEEWLESGMFRDWEKVLYRKIASLNYCELVMQSYHRGKSLYLIGKEHNIVATKVFIEYIKGVINRLAHEQYGRGKEFVASYKLALSIRLGERIEALKYADMKSDCKDLVVNEKANVDKFISEKFGKLIVQKVTMESSNSAGYYKGYQDGDKVSLNRQISSMDKNTYKLTV